jgi:hypothetical protein
MNPLGDLPSSLRRYVRDGRISVIPARRAARLLLLDQVAQAFEPGRRYPELAVNQILKSLYHDHATLRRYLVDEELLSRTPDGTYWRSGGTVTVHGAGAAGEAGAAGGGRAAGGGGTRRPR